MSGVPLIVPWTVPVSNTGVPLAGAKLHVTEPGTSTPITTYQDADLTTPHTAPIVADAEGVFPPVYVSPLQGSVKVRLTTSADVQVRVADEYPVGGKPYWGRTVAEISVGVTPTDYSHPECNVLRYGADPTGSAPSADAIAAAFSVANSYLRTSTLAGTYLPGAAVVFPGGTYSVNPSSYFEVKCNVINEGAGLAVAAAYAGEVFRVGTSTTGTNLNDADIDLPDITKPSGTSPVTGSVAVRVVNLNASNVKFGRITNGFEYGIHLGGIGQGTVYNNFTLGTIYGCKRLINMVAGSATGWCNRNNFIGGNLAIYGSRLSGYHHIYADGSTGNLINGNTFIGISLEGDGAEYVVYMKQAWRNFFVDAYCETGFVGVNCTVSGDTLTASGHGLVVGDKVSFSAATYPTGMYVLTPYWVVDVPTSDTFKISRAKGGSAITWSDSGTTVKFFRQARWLFDTGASLNQARLHTPTQNMPEMVSTGSPTGNTVWSASEMTMRYYSQDDMPYYRGGNTAGTGSRPIFAAYAPAVNPENAPTHWSAAVSDRGFLFGSAGSETGRIFNSGGALNYDPNNSGTTHKVPIGFRSSSATTLGTTSVAATSRALVTITLAGAAVGDFVVPHIEAALPDGIVLAWARVSAADTVQFCFYNWTGAPIDIAGTKLKAFVFDAYF